MSKHAFTNPVLILATALAAGALLLGLWSWQQWMQTGAAGTQARPQAATVLPEPRPLPSVELIDQNGQRQMVNEMNPGWSLWFFGFTHCPDVCPNTLGLLAAVKQTLAETAPSIRLQMVFVSVDPQRDTPEKMYDYVRYFDPGFIGLTGTHEAIDRLTSALYLPYSLDEADENGNYNVEHSGALVLVGPDHAVHAYFSAPHSREDLVHDLQMLTGKEGKPGA